MSVCVESRANDFLSLLHSSIIFFFVLTSSTTLIENPVSAAAALFFPSFSLCVCTGKLNRDIIVFYSLFCSRLLRKARYLLDRDLKDKFTAQSIDEHAIDLSLTSPGLYLKEGVTNVNPR
jgi:hypothetical protein